MGCEQEVNRAVCLLLNITGSGLGAAAPTGRAFRIEPSTIDSDVLTVAAAPIPCRDCAGRDHAAPSPPNSACAPARNSSTRPALPFGPGVLSQPLASSLRGPADWPPEAGPLLCSHAFTPAMANSAQSRVTPLYSRRTRTDLQTNVSRK
jgi:hypothetical protein